MPDRWLQPTEQLAGAGVGESDAQISVENQHGIAKAVHDGFDESFPSSYAFFEVLCFEELLEDLFFQFAERRGRTQAFVFTDERAIVGTQSF